MDIDEPGSKQSCQSPTGMPSWRTVFLTVMAGMPKPRCWSGTGASLDWALGRGSRRLAADAPPARRLPGPRLHRSAGQRRRRRSAQRSTDGRRHARHCPGAPPLWHHGVPSNPDHRYPRADANRHRGRSLDRRPGRGPRPAPGRSLHQSAASGRPSARSDRATRCGRPGGIVRTRRRRQVIGDAGARMRSGGLCQDVGRRGCADFDRAQRGVRCRCHAGCRGWRNRRHPPVQCNAAVECARARGSSARRWRNTG